MMTPAWNITCQFMALFVVCFFIMKLMNVLSSSRPNEDRLRYFLFSSFLSMRVWDQRKPVTHRALLILLLKSVIILPLMLAVYELFPAFLATHSYSWWVRGYFALVPFLIFAKTVDVIFQLILLPFCGSVPPFLDKPCLSQSLSEFWGRRWNTWHGGWFREVVFRWCRRQPVTGVFLAFVISGLWHELLIGLPLKNVFGQNIFGLMTLYFLIQFAGIIVEHEWRCNHKFVRRIWTWAVIILPIPLILNQGTLLVFHLSSP